MSTLDGTGVGRLGRRTGASIAAPLSMLAFWAAIALPVVYLPLLAAGIDTVSGLALFLGLLGLHALALAAGRGHARATGE